MDLEFNYRLLECSEGLFSARLANDFSLVPIRPDEFWVEMMVLWCQLFLLAAVVAINAHATDKNGKMRNNKNFALHHFNSYDDISSRRVYNRTKDPHLINDPKRRKSNRKQRRKEETPFNDILDITTAKPIRKLYNFNSTNLSSILKKFFKNDTQIINIEEISLQNRPRKKKKQDKCCKQNNGRDKCRPCARGKKCSKICQIKKKLVVCPPLSPPALGFYSCSRTKLSSYDLYTSKGRKIVRNTPGTKCQLQCPPGFVPLGGEILCLPSARWKAKKPSICQRANPPRIQCPSNQIYTTSSTRFVSFPAPRTNLRVKYLNAYPVWAKDLKATLPPGAHFVHFLVMDPASKLTANCSFVIIIKKK